MSKRSRVQIITATGGTLKFSFLCGIRGCQYLQVSMHAWVPTVNEVLRVEREMSNPHVYAIAAKKRLPGFHLPREVSRITHYLHGGRYPVELLEVSKFLLKQQQRWLLQKKTHWH